MIEELKELGKLMEHMRAIISRDAAAPDAVSGVMLLDYQVKLILRFYDASRTPEFPTITDLTDEKVAEIKRAFDETFSRPASAAAIAFIAFDRKQGPISKLPTHLQEQIAALEKKGCVKVEDDYFTPIPSRPMTKEEIAARAQQADEPIIRNGAE